MAPAEKMRDLAPSQRAIDQNLHIALDDVVTEVKDGLRRAVAAAFLAASEATPKSSALNAGTLSEALSSEVDHLLLRSITAGLLTAQDETGHIRRNAMMRLLVEADAPKHPASRAQSQWSEGTSDAGDVLTSEQAAKLLNVSRPHINKLLDTGLIPGVERMPGGHRRISRGAVLQYKEGMKLRQSKASREVGRISNELGLYDDELDGIPESPKRG